MIVHEASGLHYVNVFPANIVFNEIFECYKAASEKIPWMSALFSGDIRIHELSDDPAVALVFWQAFPETLAKKELKARKVLRYTESMPVDPSRTENQKTHFNELLGVAGFMDHVITHTPTAVRILDAYAKSVVLAPIGFEPSVYGVPDWTVPKTRDIGFYGSMMGRRGAVLDPLIERFGNRISVFHSFGLGRKKDLDRCKVSLYVGHCDDPSFATTRLWQTLASSAVLATEDRDAWPAVPDLHYVRLPKADPADLGSFLGAVEAMLSRTDFEAVARAAYGDLSKFTVSYSMETYVVPAIVRVRS